MCMFGMGKANVVKYEYLRNLRKWHMGIFVQFLQLLRESQVMSK